MIVILDNYDSFTFNLYQLAAAFGRVKVIRNDQITVLELAQLNPQAILISPGPGRPENAGISVEVIRYFHAKVPILGVCLGLQAITQAFGGEVVHAGEVMHGKTSQIKHNNSPLFEGIQSPFPAGRYHSLSAKRDSLPNELEVIAESEQGAVMALKHRFYPCYGVQFHPESILTPQGKQLMSNFFTQEVLSC